MRIPKVATFEWVSFGQFSKDMKNADPSFAMNPEFIHNAFEKAHLPTLATIGSAGHDFYLPSGIQLKPGETALIPTGVRAKIERGWVLMIFPRSSLGFKYRVQLDNTVGIIDSDYYDSDNEGHIMIKITNDSKTERELCLEAGDRFAQGLFIPYGIASNGISMETGTRTGGFGSTGK